MSTLERFRHEVMARGADACLPTNLSDEWIRIIASGADLLNMDPGPALPSDAAEGDERKAIALAGMATLLWAKSSGDPVQVSLSQLADYMHLYRLELTLEILHRSAELRYEPASLDSILTNRDVAAWWHDDSTLKSEPGSTENNQTPASVVDAWKRVRS